MTQTLKGTGFCLFSRILELCDSVRCILCEVEAALPDKVALVVYHISKEFDFLQVEGDLSLIEQSRYSPNCPVCSTVDSESTRMSFK